MQPPRPAPSVRPVSKAARPAAAPARERHHRPPDPLAARRAVQDAIAGAAGVVRRAQWGARPAKGEMELDWNYDSIVVHYSGHKRYTIQSIQAYDMDQKKWPDFAYHYAIERSGRIYEGRELVHKGTHVLKQNTGKIGIVCLGLYDSGIKNWAEGVGYNGEAVPPAVFRSLKRLTQVLRRVFPIRTFGGHQEYGVTEVCPGGNLLPHVVRMREELRFAAPRFRRF